MANSLTSVEQIAWEETCEEFENANVFAENADIYKPDSGYAELAGQTIRIPFANQMQSSTGLDVTGNETDVIDVTTQISLGGSDIKDVYFKLNVQESLVDRRVSDSIKAGVRKISSDVSKQIADAVIDGGALCAGETTGLTTYSHFAKADTMLEEVEAYSMDKFLYLPPRTAMGLSNELGMRQTDNSRDHRAYGYGELPSIGDFRTYKAGSLKQVAAEAVTTVTVNGANQDSDMVAYNSNVTQTAPNNDDPKSQVLTVTNTSGSLTNGDVFSIAGVNRVGIDTKIDTGQLMTFRVLSGGGTTTPVVSPAIISSGPYQNCSAVPASGAVITAHNTVAATPTVFTTKDSVRLFCSDLNWAALNDSSSVVLDTFTTTSGIQIAFLKQGSALTGIVDYRLSVWCAPTVVDPLKCGFLLPDQTTAF